MSAAPRTLSPFKQPKAVWAVASACVISFMGIGLVDPILPALSSKLRATPSQVSLLFTSYLVVTAVAMLVTGFVSSRIGAKRTLVAGLVLIVGGGGLDEHDGRDQGDGHPPARAEADDPVDAAGRPRRRAEGPAGHSPRAVSEPDAVRPRHPPRPRTASSTSSVAGWSRTPRASS
ncbi:MFS transporter, partial [Streptomyces himastatinicus]|uniref:MFS transporter n=1 Tax=Streptomyces himastatinicus TaxID=998084 RepID=UPI0001B4B323